MLWVGVGLGWLCVNWGEDVCGAASAAAPG